MNNRDWRLWENLTFKTLAYRKNFDLISTNENIITLYDGMISEIRLRSRKPPRPVGEYSFSVWNIELGQKLDVDIEKLIKVHDVENTYSELFEVVNENLLNVRSYKKIVFVQTLVLNKDYRKRGVTQELVEMLYRDFYCEDTAIIMLVKPFQNNPIDADYFFNRKEVILNETLDRSKSHSVTATEYYSLDELTHKTDTEINEYKLFTVASNCGFRRIGDSYLFLFSPDKTLKRLKDKKEFPQLTENK